MPRRKPRLGRPRKPLAEKRSKAVTVRFAPGTYVAVERAAGAADQPVADWVHDAAELALARGSTR